MEFIAEGTQDVEEGQLKEVAMVSVIWREGEQHPVIDYTGCSGFEAAALIRGALKRLEKANAKCMVFLEEGQEYEDEEDEDGDEPDD